MKKKIFISAAILLVFFLSACSSSNQENLNSTPKVVKETIDISEKNGQEIQVRVGDTLNLKLSGKDYKNYQWSLVSYEASEFLNLAEHKITVLDEQNYDFIDEWKLEVIKAGSLDLKFDFGKVDAEPESSFSVKIISQ